jgi:hypothetical protein
VSLANPKTQTESSTVTVHFTRAKYIRACAACKNVSASGSVMTQTRDVFSHRARGQTSRRRLIS